MRVLVLHNDYQIAGGETQSVATEVAGLRSIGVEVALVQSSNVEFANATPLSIISKMTHNPVATRKLLAEIRDFSPDIVHAQNLFPAWGSHAIAAFRQAGIPWVRSLRNYRLRCLSANLFRDEQICRSCSSAERGLLGVLHGCYRGSRAASAGALLYSRLEVEASKQYPPSAYIAVSKAVVDELKAVLPPEARTFTKPNAVLMPEGMADAVRGQVRQGVCFVGRLTPDKGGDLVVALAKSMSDTQFSLVGHASDEIQTQFKRMPNVTYYKRLSASETMQVMAKSRVCIVPSAWLEPFGRVALEALSVGTPAIVARRGGLAEIVEPVSSNLVVDAHLGRASWEERIRWVLSMPEHLYGCMQKNSSQHYLDRYSFSGNAMTLRSIYERCLT